MSAKLLGLGFGCDMGTPCRKLVLLKLIDACEDDGSRIFPAVATIAKAAQCSARQVQRELALFVQVGLLSIVREGGRGPKSTREYQMDVRFLRRIEEGGWDAIAGSDKGDTVSPLDDDEKGDIGDTERVTPETAKGDTACHPTPQYPSIDPSDEREARGRAGDACSDLGDDEPQATRETWVKRLKRAHQAWPTFVSDSAPAAEKAWFDLTPAERETAAERIGDYLAAAKAGGRKTVCSFGVYLAEKRWEKLPEKTQEEAPPEIAAPFGKSWGALRFAALLAGPGPLPRPTAFIERMIAAGDEAGERERLAHLARHGWPEVNAMHEKAATGGGVPAAAALKPLELLFGRVRTDGDMWAAWERLHRRSGWPWLDTTRPPDFVWLPDISDEEMHEMPADEDMQVAAAIERFKRELMKLKEGESNDDGAARRAG